MALPYDLIDQVLCRVPVKYLLRCRCVSKEWCSLIDSTAFVKKHFKTTIECNATGLILSGEETLFLTDLDSLSAGEDVDVMEMKDPLKTVFPDADFVGAASCLLCFSKNNATEFLLYNPATRKHRKVPSIPFEFVLWFDMVEVSYCGFGYDHVSDDYKIAKIKIRKFFGMTVIVYSLKSNCWTRICSVPEDIRMYPNFRLGLFASGALHWLAIKNLPVPSYIILGFDLGLEQFKEVPCRNGLFNVTNGGYLCILDQCTNSRTDVWLMNNHGTENPWYEAFSVEKPCALGSFRAFCPVAFSRGGKDVLLEVDHERLVWYDLERKVAKNVRIHGVGMRFNSHVYRESLLQLTENEQLLSHQRQEKEETTKEKGEREETTQEKR